VDVYDISAGYTDSFMVMGDSITFMSLQRQASDVSNLVNAGNSAAWPALINAAAGGTSSGEGMKIIDDILATFPGKFICLAYGTNDQPETLYEQMATIVRKIIAAQRVPVVPYMIWPNQDQEKPLAKLAEIDRLYADFPEILRGPDLYNRFLGHDEWIAPGDIHPTGEGMEELRRAWADWILSTYE
jgi:lysophospholipase L1-like esterase